MLRAFALVGLCMVGCTQDDEYPLEGSFLSISVDTRAFPGFDHLQLYYARGPTDGSPIATPAILAGTEPPAQAVTRWNGVGLVQIPYGASYKYQLWELTGFPSEVYIGVAAVGGNGAATAGGSSGPVDHPDDLALEVALDPALRTELWGAPSTSGPCFRVSSGSATFFVTRSDDVDCDGLPNSSDSQPNAYCDPAATIGPARDACL